VRARHTASLRADLAADACLHAREVLVLGRAGERPGVLTTATTVVRGGVPVLRQRLTVGDPDLDASVAYLAGKRVLATDLRVGGDPCPPASGEWWSRTPLATPSPRRACSSGARIRQPCTAIGNASTCR
jgi:urease accessory protein